MKNPTPAGSSFAASITPGASGDPPDPPAAAAPELNLRLLGHLLRYVRDRFGDEAIERIRAESGIAQLEGGNRWASLAQFEVVLQVARSLMRSDAEFVAACSYELEKVSGPVRFLIGAISPVDAYELGARNMRLVSTISAFEPERRGYGRVFIRYRSAKPESRLMCLSRQAQIAALPTLWGLPRAEVVEESCLARGDATCGYAVRVQENRAWLTTALGGVAGGIGALALSAAGVVHVGTFWAAPIIGMLSGAVVMLHRHARASRAVADDINAAYLEAAREDVNARRALFELAMRTQHWTHLMEQQVAGRAMAMHQVSDAVERLRGDADSAGPVSGLRDVVSALSSRAGALEPGARSAVAELEGTVSKLDMALASLQRMVSAGSQIVALNPRWVETEPLAGDLRSRLQAVTLRKDVRTSVFAVREAPERVRIDVPLFNRITDALLANAARSTERGSIVVEVGGGPDTLTIKVSDTGAGLSPDDVRTILSTEPQAAGETTERSWASGMWVVARMLAAIGGRLEVKSGLGAGTTFWAHYPIDAGASTRSSSHPPPDLPRETTGTEAPDLRKVN
jgi:signal transduction histidine kinase